MSKWPTVKLDDVLKERQERPSPEKITLGQIPIVAKIGFDDGKIQLRTESHTKTGMILIRPGDVVVSGINAAKGAIAIYGTDNNKPIAATIHYGAYIANPKRADVRFLWWLLRSNTFREILMAYVPGGIKTELKPKRLLPVPIPLPPLSEQRRIVARIEELAAKINEARELRRTAAKEAEAPIGAELRAKFLGFAKVYPVKALEELTSHIIDGPHVTPHYLPNGFPGIPFVTVKNMVTGRLSTPYRYCALSLTMTHET